MKQWFIRELNRIKAYRLENKTFMYSKDND